MTVKIEGLGPIIKKLDSLGKPGAFKRPMTRAVNHLYGKMKKEPSKAAGAFSSMATDKQRRAYWAKVREKPSIHGPGGYIRSHTLQKGWTKNVSPNGRRGVVENAVPYGEWVQGLRQQRFHAASRYPRTDKVAEKEAPFIVKIFKREYDRLVK